MTASLDVLLTRAAEGDQAAFADLYDQVAGRVLGLATRIVRDPAQAEEVAQEALLEVWRTAARFDPAKGSALSYLLAITHRRSVDRVRAAQAGADRERKVAATAATREYDVVAETAEAAFERTQVRVCLDALTAAQREAITLAYWGGRTYREVAELLGVALPTIKTRMRDGLIRLRDCLEVAL
ncbi:ECF RNA polymerase sigma factor SigK [Hamadaea sp. NPDC051192]|nr:ECF RNA polymerase sigma factor SigK [Hamadaea flava]